MASNFYSIITSIVYEKHFNALPDLSPLLLKEPGINRVKPFENSESLILLEFLLNGELKTIICGPTQTSEEFLEKEYEKVCKGFTVNDTEVLDQINMFIRIFPGPWCIKGMIKEIFLDDKGAVICKCIGSIKWDFF